VNLTFLLLKDFRNYPHLELELTPGASLFIGENAQGKTNLLEACYYLSTLDSPRAERDSDLVRWGASTMLVAGRLKDRASKATIKVETTIGPSLKKKVLVNDRHARKQDVLAAFPCVYFCPDDLYVVKGSSSLRRKFLDSLLARQDTQYARELARYQDILSRRNVLLKNPAKNRSWNQTLEALDQLLVSSGSQLVFKRLCVLKTFTAHVQKMYSFIYESSCEISYVSSLGHLHPDLDSIKDRFRCELQRSKPVQKTRGVTVVGPHRDDISIVFDNKTFRYFGSQGQQRSMALALKLAEAKSLEDTFNTKPVLLLDDVFSELDGQKRRKVLSLCDFGYQILFTSTDLPSVGCRTVQMFRVSDNTVTRI